MKVVLTRRLPAAATARLDGIAELVQLEDGHAALVAGVAAADALVSLITDRIDAEVIGAGAALKVIANVGVGFNNIDVAVTESADALRDALYRQAFGPVRWVEVVLALKARGLTHIIECGPEIGRASCRERV